MLARRSAPSGHRSAQCRAPHSSAGVSPPPGSRPCRRRVADLVARFRGGHRHRQVDDVARGAKLAVGADRGDLGQHLLVQVAVVSRFTIEMSPSCCACRLHRCSSPPASTSRLSRPGSCTPRRRRHSTPTATSGRTGTTPRAPRGWLLRRRDGSARLRRLRRARDLRSGCEVRGPPPRRALCI